MRRAPQLSPYEQHHGGAGADAPPGGGDTLTYTLTKAPGVASLTDASGAKLEQGDSFASATRPKDVHARLSVDAGTGRPSGFAATASGARLVLRLRLTPHEGGGGGTLGHPQIFLTMGNDGMATCPYCSREFVNSVD